MSDFLAAGATRPVHSAAPTGTAVSAAPMHARSRLVALAFLCCVLFTPAAVRAQLGAASVVDVFAGGGDGFTDLVIPGQRVTLFWEAGATGNVPDTGRATLTLPPTMKFVSWQYWNGMVKSFTVDGQEITVEIDKNDHIGIGSRGKFEVHIVVDVARVTDLPQSAEAFHIPTHVEVQRGAESATHDANDEFYFLYQKGTFSVTGDAEPEGLINCQLTIAPFPLARMRFSRIFISPAHGTDMIQGSLTGAGSGTVAFNGGFSVRWDGGVDTQPRSLTMSYQMRVRKRENLPPGYDKVEVPVPSYYFEAQTDYFANSNDGPGKHKRGTNGSWAPGDFVLEFDPEEPEPIKLTVNSTADRPRDAEAEDCDTGETIAGGDAECTLRAAIETVNAGVGTSVDFAIPGATPPTITPLSPLPAMTKPITLDASTQPGGFVVLDGGGLETVGLDVAGGDSEIRGFVVGNFGGPQAVGIRVRGPGDNVIAGNRVGTDAAGTGTRELRVGIQVKDSPNNRIGGAGADWNLVHGASAAVEVRGAAAVGNRIGGNRIALGATGQPFDPRPVVGVAVIDAAQTKVGGDGLPGNLIGGTKEMAVVIAGVAARVDGTVVTDNRIGLDGTGSAAVGGVMGIVVVAPPGNSGAVGTRVTGNRVAGHEVDVLVAGTETQGTVLQGNTIGLRFDGAGAVPTGLGADRGQFGVRLDNTQGTQLIGNVVAGHAWNVVVAGLPELVFNPCADDDGDGLCDSPPEYEFFTPDEPAETPSGTATSGAVLDGNTIGLTASLAVPTGATQDYGVTVFSGANTATIRNGTFGGHAKSEILLVDGAGHVVQGNRIGTSTGDVLGSRTGVLVRATTDALVGGPDLGAGNVISANSVAGVHVAGAAKGTRIAGNKIGTNVGGTAPWPNGIGVLVEAEDGADAPEGTVVENNVVGGNVGGVVLAAPTDVRGNRIGVGPGGEPVPNESGVLVDDVATTLYRNTIAHNTQQGVGVAGTAPVLIEGGPIYQNGDGGAAAGIDYDTPPFPPPNEVLVVRSQPDATGNLTVILAVPTEPGDDVPVIEVYGNRSCDEPQGRVPLARGPVFSGATWAERFEVNTSSAMATLEGFTATITRGSSTSTFSTCSGPWRFAGVVPAECVTEDLLDVIRYGEPGETTRMAVTPAAEGEVAGAQCSLAVFDALLAAATPDQIDSKTRKRLDKLSGQADAKLDAAVAAGDAGKTKKEARMAKGATAALRKMAKTVAKGVTRGKVDAGLGASLGSALARGQAAIAASR